MIITHKKVHSTIFTNNYNFLCDFTEYHTASLIISPSTIQMNQES